MWPVERLHTELIRNHVSRTHARDQVYVALTEIGPCHTSALVGILQGQLDQTTVHRTIKLFLKIGITTRSGHGLVELAPPFRQHHHHITCPQCGKITDFLSPKIEAELERIHGSRRLIPQAHQIEITAICGLCQLA